jgi:uncharacterized protein YndB with AHSA1/START domain
MARCSLSVDIRAPLALVWSLTQDLARRAEWDFRVTGARLLTAPPVGKGSRIRAEGHFVLGFSYQMEFVTFEPMKRTAGRILCFEGGMPISHGAGTWTYQDLGEDGCRFCTTLVLHARGGALASPLDRLWLSPFIHWATRKSLRQLKALAEREARQQPLLEPRPLASGGR